MWVCVTIIFVVPAVVVTMQILSPERSHLPEETCAGLNRITGQPFDASKWEISKHAS